MEGQSFDTDFLVIGSGFGGSVSAMRLTEKGYRVIIAEQGKHISPETMPKTVRDIKQFLWLPALKYKGFFHFSYLSMLWCCMVMRWAVAQLLMPTPYYSQQTKSGNKGAGQGFTIGKR